MNKPILVLKVGGAFAEQNTGNLAFFQALKKIQSAYAVILVHGGGNAVAHLLKQLGYTTQKINGLRVTPQEQLPYVVGVLAGSVNKTLVSQALRAELEPVGISMADGVIAICQTVKDELGAVGEVVRVNTKLLTTLIEGQFLPLVSSIGSDINGQLLNINADDAATAIAQALDAELLLLSDVPGVLDAEKNLLTSLPPSHTQQLIAQGVIADGMQVKVQAAQQAANQLGRPVTIGSWRNADGLLKLFHAQMPGTQVLPSNH